MLLLKISLRLLSALWRKFGACATAPYLRAHPRSYKGVLLSMLVTALWGAHFFEQQAKAASQPLADVATQPRSFSAAGVVEQVDPDRRVVVIAHNEITNYMKAMTMPFKVRNTTDLQGLQSGDQVSFIVHVTDTESWVDHLSKTGTRIVVKNLAAGASTPAPPPTKPHHPLMDYPFTNELGQAVSLGQFHGQALAITFFFTRCPIPEFCPRLSRNFEEASQKLTALPHAPTNWHFLSITFDPQFDTPTVLKSYAERYQYDPAHWSFLTGPVDKIRELAEQSQVTFKPDTGLFNHNFRTLIIDAAGHLQMVFPTSGDLSDAIVSEILKAAAVTDRSS